MAVVAVGDPEDRTTWSGTPRGLIDGFRGNGHEVIAISALPRTRLTRSLQQALIAARRILRGGERSGPRTAMRQALYGKEWGAVLGRTARRRLRGHDPDLIVQATEGWMTLPGRTIVYLDATTRQQIRSGEFTQASQGRTIEESREAGARSAYASGRGFCASTPWAAASVVDDYGIPASKVAAVGIGCAMPEITAVDKDWSTPRFLFVGASWERKNGPTVLAAFEKFRRRHPEAELHLVGERPEADLPTGVTVHGFLHRDDESQQARLRTLYARATCLVVPSRFEPAGIVYVEAARAGIPAICGEAGGAADLVGDGGRIVPPGSADALTAAMEELADPQVAKKAGARLRLRLEDTTWSEVARRIEAMHRGVPGPECSARAWAGNGAPEGGASRRTRRNEAIDD